MDDYVLKLLGTGTVVATAAAWYMFKKPAAFNPNFDFSQQSRDAQVSSVWRNARKLQWKFC